MTTSFLANNVRSRDSVLEDVKVKRPRTEKSSSINARILVTAEGALTQLNAVWMHPFDICKLFPKSSPQEQISRRVNLADHIFKLLSRQDLEQGTILVNYLQNQQIQRGKYRSEKGDHIFVTSVDSQKSYLEAKKIELKFEPAIPVKSPLHLPLDYFQTEVLSNLKGAVLTHQQTLYFEDNYGCFQVTVFLDDKTATSHQLITPTTQVHFLKNPHVVFYKKEEKLSVRDQSRLKVELISYNTPAKKKNLGNTLVDVDKLKSEIAKSFLGKNFFEGERVDIEREEVSYAFLVSIDLDEDLLSQKYGYQNAYTFDEEPIGLKLKISSPLKKEITFYSGVEDASAVEFEVDQIQKGKDTKPEYDTKPVSVEKLMRLIKSLPGLCDSQQFEIPQKKRTLVIKVIDVRPYRRHETFTAFRKIVDSTQIRFSPKNKKTVLIDNKVPANIVKIFVKVKQKPQFSLFGPMPLPPLKLVEEKLEKICIRELKGELYNGLVREIECEDAKNKTVFLRIKVKKIEFADESLNPKYGCQGYVDYSSQFEFDSSPDSNIKLTTEENEQNTLPMDIDALEEVVGGISGQLKTILRKVFLAHGPLKELSQRRGVKPIKGMLLYGPPGTGKTTLARNIGKAFGCTGDRFQCVTASELINKYVGETERNIRELFKPAEKSLEEQGKNSKLHIIVIDECETLAEHREGEDSANRKAWLGQLLGKLDGLKQLNNIFVILMTNRPDLIDPAVLRPGRIELHLKLGLPDAKGRKEIFTIHTKALKEENAIGDIDLDTLVEKTLGFSGADIEGIVKDAVSYSFERLHALKLSLEAAEKNEAGTVTMEDFIRAIDALPSKKEDDKTSYMA